MLEKDRQQLRRLWFKVHKWLGLSLAAPVLLIFLSGAVLVWKSSVDDLLHPQRHVSAAASQAPSFYVAAAERIAGPEEHVASLTYPPGNGAVVISTVAGASSSMQGRFRYFLHPVTGVVLDRASIDAGPLRVVHLLHGSLLLGRFGARLVGAVAFVLLLSAFSGLWLWWPRKGALVRGFRWGRTNSINANLHHQAGYWIALPLVILCLTGATISFPGLFAALSGDAAAAEAEFARNSAPPLSHTHLDLSHVLAAVGSPRPSAIAAISWPTTADPRWHVTYDQAGAMRTIDIDDVTARALPPESPPRQSASRLMRRIHDGTDMPFAWRLVIFFSGLGGFLLVTTGVIMWLRAQVRDKRMRRRRKESALRV